MMKIISVIPTFNRCKELKDLLTMLSLMRSPSDITLECICVVNGLSDGTLEMIETMFPDVQILKGNPNWWYTKSMNEGFKHAENMNPDFILTLNDDIVLPNDYLTNLVNTYQKIGRQCILGSASFTFDRPHKVINAGVKNWNRFLDKTNTYVPFLSEVSPSSFSGAHKSPVLPGRGTLIPWTVLKSLSFFDESFAQYHSDYDFTLRALRYGVPVYISWDAQIFSYLEKTNSGSSFLRSSFLTLLKNFSNPHSRVYILDKSKYYWRHGYKSLWPWYMIKFLVLAVLNHFYKSKIA